MKYKFLHWCRVVVSIPSGIIAASVAQVAIKAIVAFMLSIGPFRPDDDSDWPMIIGGAVGSVLGGVIAIEVAKRISPSGVRWAPKATFIVGLVLCAATMIMRGIRQDWESVIMAALMIYGMYSALKTARGDN